MAIENSRPFQTKGFIEPGLSNFNPALMNTSLTLEIIFNFSLYPAQGGGGGGGGATASEGQVYMCVPRL